MAYPLTVAMLNEALDHSIKSLEFLEETTRRAEVVTLAEEAKMAKVQRAKVAIAKSIDGLKLAARELTEVT